MTDNRSNSENLWFRLPIEIIQDISYLLPDDSDVTNLASTCTFLAERTLPPQSWVWRKRFKDLYNMPRQRSSFELKLEYQTRRIVLGQNIDFRNGEDEQQTLWLEVLKDMILEALVSSDPPASKNIARITTVLSNADFFNRPVSGYQLSREKQPSDLFCAVQLCLSGLALDPTMSFGCLRTDYNITTVYSYETDTRIGFVESHKLNLTAVLHIRNFWLRHLLNSAEATFFGSYQTLTQIHRPKALGQLYKKELELHTDWLGYYSCIHPYPETLASLEARQTCADLDSHWTHVERMTLRIKPHSESTNWPALFETIISAQSRNLDTLYFQGFQGTDVSSGDSGTSVNLVRGFVETIKTSQGGFPGWYRICFAIYKPNRERLSLGETNAESSEQTEWFPQETWPPTNLEEDFHWIHGYEGVMLPGCGMIIGHWIDMVETSARGPFIFWNS